MWSRSMLAVSGSAWIPSALDEQSFLPCSRLDDGNGYARLGLARRGSSAAPAELGSRRRGRSTSAVRQRQRGRAVCWRVRRWFPAIYRRPARLIGVLAPRYNSSLIMGPLDRRALEVGYFLVFASVVVFLASPVEAASFGVPVMAGGVLLAWLCEDTRES